MNLEVNKFQEIEAKFHQGIKAEQLHEELIQLGHSDEILQECMRIYRQLKFEKQRKSGFKFLALGAFFCLASCIITFFHNYSDNSTIFTLYGITLIGACFLLIGLALVLGL